MSQNLRLLLHKKVSQVLNNDKIFKPGSVTDYLKLKFNEDGKFVYTFPLRSKQYDVRKEASKLLDNEYSDYLDSVNINENNPNEVIFHLNRDNYIKGLVDSLKHNVISPGIINKRPENIIVEFSSPNIAKPFHVGHLRSTIIGNYIANINYFFKNNVKKINYLGDWGTQFGFVKLGLTLTNTSEETLKKDPINILYDAYVHANKLAEEDPMIANKARNIFQKLESGDESSLQDWELCRKYTIEELNKTYKRLGIEFDEYEWESMYNIKEINTTITKIERLNLFTSDTENRKVISLNGKKVVPIIKSDGSSLYITRDIAAAIHRFEKYKFDTMYYVVDNAQTQHFMNLTSILKAMKLPWADQVQHIKFGKIRGISTRKGTAVFLKDFLDETRAVMKEKQIQSPNTKVDISCDDQSTETLGISAVIINDLKHKRNQDYDFSWEKALDIRGNTGVKLQYTHCRLVSLEKNTGVSIASECIPSLLLEPAAEDLVYIIAKFDETLVKSYQELEPYILVKYLFELSTAVGSALHVLKIKGEASELASQRLLLMHVARKVLAQGMRLLGLTPLEKM